MKRPGERGESSLGPRQVWGLRMKENGNSCSSWRVLVREGVGAAFSGVPGCVGVGARETQGGLLLSESVSGGMGRLWVWDGKTDAGGNSSTGQQVDSMSSKVSSLLLQAFAILKLPLEVLREGKAFCIGMSLSVFHPRTQWGATPRPRFGDVCRAWPPLGQPWLPARVSSSQ